MGEQTGKQLEIEQRQGRVTELYIRGLSQRAIAQELSVCAATVCHDIAAVHDEWKETRISDLNALKNEQVAKLNVIASEAWAAWERSKEPEVTNKAALETAGGDEKKKTERQEKTRVGDAKYLDIIEKTIAQTCKIRQLYEPDQIEIITNQTHDLAPDTAAAQFDRIILLIAERRGANGIAPSGNGNGQAVVDAGEILPPEPPAPPEGIS